MNKHMIRWNGDYQCTLRENLNMRRNFIESHINVCLMFHTLLNGSKYEKFTASRGLHWGDPLSLYLFIIAVQTLSRLIFFAESRGVIHGINVSRETSPLISYLLCVSILKSKYQRRQRTNEDITCLWAVLGTHLKSQIS